MPVPSPDPDFLLPQTPASHPAELLSAQAQGVNAPRSASDAAAERNETSDQRYRALLESIDVGFCIIEMLFDEQNRPHDYRFVEYNPAFERHTGLSNAIGRTVRELVSNLDDFWFRTYGNVALTGEARRFENHAPAMNRWFDVYALRVGPAEERKVCVFFTDVTDRKTGQAAVQKLAAVVENSSDFISISDLDGTGLFLNEAGRRLVGLTEHDDISRYAIRDFLYPEDRDALTGAFLPGVLETGQGAAEVRFRHVQTGEPIWVNHAMFTVPDHETGENAALVTITRDIRERKSAEARERAREAQERARLTDIFMQAPAFMAVLRTPQHVFELANPPYYQLVGHRDLIGKPVSEALPEVVEQGFIALLDQVYRTGEAFIGKDMSITLQVEPDGPLEERFLDFSYQPLFGEDREVTGILAHGIDLTDRKRLEQERERLLDEQRARAEREALLNQIGMAVRGVLEPEAILRAAVTELGQGLGADRCYFVRYDQERDTARVFSEWLRDGAGGEALMGRVFQMSTYSVDRDDGYKAGATHVVDDVVAYAPDDAAPLLSLGLRALLRVPIEIGDQMRAITVSMANEPRGWTREEVRLVENVAAMVRSALESAHIQQRERNIAQQLQEALQPPAPGNLPGLALASFYRPALNEASVGGDFFDVFPVACEVTALVVADLSGKGLAAASQVATVRNMLRFALYKGETVARAVCDLHEMLVQHELLTGFATLFVGLYDPAFQTLTYVNCGQEPGLLWRAATGVVEELAPTGPVLGGFAAQGAYEQRVIALEPQDALALFTDGLTEVGATRKDLLEIAGVSEMFAACCAAEREISPDAIVSRLVASVDRFARGGIRDDIALLVGVASGDEIPSASVANAL